MLHDPHGLRQEALLAALEDSLLVVFVFDVLKIELEERAWSCLALPNVLHSVGQGEGGGGEE